MASILLGRGIQLRVLELTTRWQEHHPSRPWQFTDEWNRAYRHLQGCPEGASPAPGSRKRLRRLLLQGCQYHIVYLYRPPPWDQVLIIAIRPTGDPAG
jgi:hypothetical protein